MKNKLYYQFAGSCFLLVFVFLGYVVKFYPQWLSGFDQALTKLVRLPYPDWHPFYLWITKFANPISIVLLAAAFLALFVTQKLYAEALWLLLGVGGVAGIGNHLLKLAFLRPRPTLHHVVTEHSYSFPSGHSTGSMVLFGTLLLLVPIFTKNKVLRLGLQFLLGALILTIGVSRIYLGVHFPTDVLAGFCIGLAWLLMTCPIYQEYRFTWRFKGKQR